jgi:hypothetical protein
MAYAYPTQGFSGPSAGGPAPIDFANEVDDMLDDDELANQDVCPAFPLFCSSLICMNLHYTGLDRLYVPGQDPLLYRRFSIHADPITGLILPSRSIRR